MSESTIRGRPIKVANKKPDDLQYTDVSFVAVWDAKDQPWMDTLYHNKIRILNKKFNELRYKELRLYLKNIRTGQYPNIHDIPGIQKIWKDKAEYHEIRWRLIEDFENIITRDWNDQTPQSKYQPQQTVKQEDLVTNYGMERIAALTCNESNTYFTHIAAGASLIPAGIGQITLFDEKARTPVDTTGWMTAKGRLIRGGAEFPRFIPSFDCGESAIIDHATAGGCAWRTVYPADKVATHTTGETYLTVSHTVDQGSVGL
jgi:hypothetical protein